MLDTAWTTVAQKDKQNAKTGVQQQMPPHNWKNYNATAKDTAQQHKATISQNKIQRKNQPQVIKKLKREKKGKHEDRFDKQSRN